MSHFLGFNDRPSDPRRFPIALPALLFLGLLASDAEAKGPKVRQVSPERFEEIKAKQTAYLDKVAKCGFGPCPEAAAPSV